MSYDRVEFGSRKCRVLKLLPRVIEYFQSTEVPVVVGDVANLLGVSWSTARQVLMELALSGEIECEVTTRGRIFRRAPNKESLGHTRRSTLARRLVLNKTREASHETPQDQSCVSSLGSPPH